MTTNGNATSRELVGHVSVDTGGLVVLDQIHAKLSDEDHQRIMASDVPGTTVDCGDKGLHPRAGQIGAFVHTGIGDGRYPVYAEVADVPWWGRRVVRIVIDCSLGIEDEER